MLPTNATTYSGIFVIFQISDWEEPIIQLFMSIHCSNHGRRRATLSTVHIVRLDRKPGIRCYCLLLADHLVGVANSYQSDIFG